MDIAKKFGYRLQQIRLAKNMTQEALAYEIEKTPHYISDIETGKRKPNLNTLISLIEALGTTPNELFCDLVTVENHEATEMLQMISEIPDEDRVFYLNILRNYKDILKRKK